MGRQILDFLIFRCCLVVFVIQIKMQCANLVNDTIDETLISLLCRLAIIHNETIIGESILMTHQVIALLVQVPMDRPHAREIFRLSHQPLTFHLLLSLPRKDGLENSLDAFAVRDFVDECVDVALGGVAIELALQVAKFAITLPDHCIVNPSQLRVVLVQFWRIFIVEAS